MWKAISLSLDEETIKLLRQKSKETDIPISRLVKRAIWEMYGNEKTECTV